MQQSSHNSCSVNSSKMSSINVAKEIETKAREFSPQSDVYYASSHTSLFSSSLPVLIHKKYNGYQSVNNACSSLNKFHQDAEGNHSLNEDEDRATGSFLPRDEDELLDGFDLSWLPKLVDDSEEYDFFGSGGGLELESEPSHENLSIGISKVSLYDGVVGNGVAHCSLPNGAGTIAVEHPLGEHPSRTLFVRNINSSVEDSELRTLFERYGDIRTMYTACKHRGFVMISYYDIRAAWTAMRALQNKPLRRRKLDIHFSIPKENPSEKDINQGTLVVFNLDPSVSHEDLHQIFGAYGEVKEIRETSHKRHHKFIEFHDVRAAEAALRSLNRSDIAGTRIKVEPSRSGGARRSLTLQLNQELEGDLSRNLRYQVDSPIGNFPPGNWPHFGNPVEPSSLQILSKSPGFGSLSSPVGNGLPGLASILQSQMSNCAKVENFTFTDGNSNHRGIFEQSHSFPEQKSSQYSEIMSPLAASSSNGSSIETLSGRQFMFGSPRLYPEPTNSSFWRKQPIRQPFTSNGHNGFPYAHHGSVHSSSYVGSAPSGVPSGHHFSFYQESLKTAFMSPGFKNGQGFKLNMSENHSLVSNVMLSPRLSPVFLGTGHFPGLAASNVEGLEVGRCQQVDNNGNHIHNKKHFQLDLDKIKNGEDNRTTLMIKNIPNKYTSKMMLTTIDEHHGGTYDLFYLPIDFKNKCNVGYAFINMLSPSHIIPFYEAFNGKLWEKFNSEKVAFLAYARIQGKTALVAHFENSSLMNEDKRCRPILFNSVNRAVQIIQEHLPSSGLNIQVSQPNGSSPENSSGSMREDRSGDEVEKGEQWQWKQNVPSKQEHATPLTVPYIWCTENR